MAFNRTFRCISGVMDGKEGIDRGGKINLPHDCLGELARMEITYPMMFKVSNPVTGLASHSGVLEFTAPEGTVVAPFWLMEHLGVPQGGNLRVQNASLPRGTFIKIQPQQKAFIDLSNPKAVLESRMNGYSCLTKGDVIAIHYQDRTYPIAIRQCRVGDREVESISIVEANVNVEFERPADMPPSPVQKPAPPPASGYSGKPAASASAPASGVSFGNTLLDRAEGGDSSAPAKPAGGSAAPAPTNPGGFAAFSGAGKSLSGAAKPAGGPIGGRIPPRGTDSLGRPLKAAPTEEAEEKKGFAAFSGKGRSLK